jgi:hypothetical protein
MTTVQSDIGQQPLILHTRPVFEMSDELFFDFCQNNREWDIERNALGAAGYFRGIAAHLRVSVERV